jgi:HK97 family phage prohead protease
METLRDLDLVRALPPQAKPTTVRAGSTNTDAAAWDHRLTVRFSPFETWYEINSMFEGQFLEQTVRGAFAKTMRESGTGVKVQFDHGHDTAVGSRVLAYPEELREDADSAVLEGDLFDTTYNRDLLPGLKAGAYGSSFRFQVIKDEWNDEPGTGPHNPKGLPERTIKEVRLFEAGPVVFPANPEATSSARSMTDQFWQRAAQRDPQVEGLLARARELRAPKPTATVIDLAPAIPTERTSPATEAAPSTPEPAEAARTTDDEPATRHSSGYLPHQRRALIHPILSRKDTP